MEDLEKRGLIYLCEDSWKSKFEKIAWTDVLPASIGSMISRKIERLEQEERRLLTLAAVQGYEFDVEVLARVISLDVIDVEDLLSKIESHSWLIRKSEEKKFPNGILSEHYRFVHILYRNALFDQLSLGRKVRWCKQIADILVQFYQKRAEEIASQLGVLYEWAQEPNSAVEHYKIAAKHASTINAFHEAKVLARKGLELINDLDTTKIPLELELVTILAGSSIATDGYAHPEILKLNTRALDLCHKIEDSAKRMPILLGLMVHYLMNADLANVEKINLEISSLSQAFEHPGYLGTAYQYYSTTLVSCPTNK